jgi:hypothetical protein
MTKPYTYDERILVQEDADAAVVIRLESFMAWRNNKNKNDDRSRQQQQQRLVHPFGKLQEALASPLDDYSSSSPIRQVTVSVASRSSQSFRFSHDDNDGDDDDDTASSLQNIPLLGHHTDANHNNNNNNNKNTNVPHFPSGFWLEILAERSLSLAELNSLVDHWRDRRVITTPTEGSVWDREEIHRGVLGGDDNGDGDDDDEEYPPQKLHRHQLFLPATGAAWSADAWQQTMQALLPSCGNGGGGDDFFGVSATDWSKLLVEGPTTHKQFWIQWSSQQQQVNIGLQFQSSSSEEEKEGFQTHLPPTLFSEKASCPLATRSIQRISSSASSSKNHEHAPSSTITLEQVLRQQLASPNHGRLETWFTSSSSSSSSLLATNQIAQQDCQLQIRQKLPYFLAPQWQSLQITSNTNDKDNDDDDDADSHYTASVEWDDDDLSAVLRITTSFSSMIPTSLIVVSLDYEPIFLSIDEFPGDPNRGRELPPAVATFQCHHHHTTTTVTTLFSNSVLLLPPVPDMSMPFNVLSLSCSLYAYLIGTIVTLLVKRSSERIKYQLHPQQKPESKLKQLKSKILLSKLFVFVQQRRRRTTKLPEELPENDDKEEETKDNREEAAGDVVPTRKE